MLTTSRLARFLTSSWLRTIAGPYIGPIKIGILAKDTDGVRPFTWTPLAEKEADVFVEGFTPDMNGVLTVDRTDPYWDEAEVDLDKLDGIVSATEEEKLAASARLEFQFTSRFFSQLAQQTLSEPLIQNPFFVWLAGFFGASTEFLAFFVDAKGPQQNILASHRVYWSGSRWVVTQDLAGGADRLFTMDAADVREYITRLRRVQLSPWYSVFFALFNFGLWYRNWVNETSIRLK